MERRFSEQPLLVDVAASADKRYNPSVVAPTRDRELEDVAILREGRRPRLVEFLAQGRALRRGGIEIAIDILPAVIGGKDGKVAVGETAQNKAVRRDRQCRILMHRD